MRDGGGDRVTCEIAADLEAGCSANFFRGGVVGLGLRPGLRFSLGFVRRGFGQGGFVRFRPGNGQTVG